MTDESRTTQVRGVSLYPQDWEIIDKRARQIGGRSAALRAILREWAQEHQQETADD